MCPQAIFVRPSTATTAPKLYRRCTLPAIYICISPTATSHLPNLHLPNPLAFAPTDVLVLPPCTIPEPQENRFLILLLQCVAPVPNAFKSPWVYRTPPRPNIGLMQTHTKRQYPRVIAGQGSGCGRPRISVCSDHVATRVEMISTGYAKQKRSRGEWCGGVSR